MQPVLALHSRKLLMSHLTGFSHTCMYCLMARRFLVEIMRIFNNTALDGTGGTFLWHLIIFLLTASDLNKQIHTAPPLCVCSGQWQFSAVSSLMSGRWKAWLFLPGDKCLPLDLLRQLLWWWLSLLHIVLWRTARMFEFWLAANGFIKRCAVCEHYLGRWNVMSEKMALARYIQLAQNSVPPPLNQGTNVFNMKSFTFQLSQFLFNH